MNYLLNKRGVPNGKMSAATVTEVIEPRISSEDPIQCKLRQNANFRNTITQELRVKNKYDSIVEENQECDNIGNGHRDKTDNKSKKLCPYDVVLKSISEPSFMKPIREWEKRHGFVTPVRWVNTILIAAIHGLFFFWILKSLIFHTSDSVKWQTVVFAYIMGQVSGFGVTAGAHRHWCHRAYKASWPLKLILVFCYSVAGQNTIYEWVRDHRVHHKFSETPADPHDANRGFFFSHMGWLMMKKHPDVIREGKKIDMSDVLNDPFVRIHTRYFMVFKALCAWIVPSVIPYLFWGETLEGSFMSQAVVRYILSLHFTWSVNSVAHLWGNKPYDRFIMPVENRCVSIVAMGEGWHNYHHTFPWDYKAAELGVTNNVTTTVLNFFARLGWAYDLKEASPALVKAVAKARGEPQDAK